MLPRFNIFPFPYSSRPEFPGRYGGDARPYEYRDEGHENNEDFEIVDEEDRGRFGVKGYRQPIQVGNKIIIFTRKKNPPNFYCIVEFIQLKSHFILKKCTKKWQLF